MLPDDDTGADVGGPGCEHVVVATAPPSGGTDVFYRDGIQFQLAVAPGSASVTVTAGGGAVIRGTTTVDDVQVSWSGDPLVPGVSHVATLSIDGCEDQSIDFVVSETGRPTGDVDSRVFDVDVSSGSWTEPPGVGTLIALAEIESLWLSPTVADGEIGMAIAFLEGPGEQDICLPTVAFPPTTFEDPWFSATTAELPLEFYGVEVGVREVTLSGAFSPDGSEIDELSLTGTLDVREIEPLLIDIDICGFVADLGEPCFACLDGVDACVTLTVEDVEATYDPTLTLVERTPEDIELDPACPFF